MKLQVNVNRSRGTINKNIYGHFSEHLGRCIYQGLYVGEDSAIPNVNGMRKDVVDALKAVQVPVLRWPGGCFADEYHWRDGIGPMEKRKRMVNTHWGGVVEDNSFGTHEFFELCRQIGCAPYVNANLGSGTVREMADWVEYLNSDSDSSVVQERWANGRKEPFGVKYFGVGNENWGCGGSMRPSYYADEYRRYQTYCRNFGENKLYRIACGPNSADYQWTDELMQIAGRHMDALTLHYYTVPTGEWNKKGSATEFDEALYFETLRKAVFMDALIDRHLSVMDKHDPDHRVGLIVDEWGTWFDVEPGTNPGFLYQQNTMRDAMVAALTLNIFNAHCDRVVMANLAQTVNVLQALILTEGDRMVLTPTYHVFDLYKAHQDADCVDWFLQGAQEKDGVPAVSASASRKGDVLTVTVAHTGLTESQPLCIETSGLSAQKVSGRILTGAMDAHNDFGKETAVAVANMDDIEIKQGCVAFTLPPCSVAEITIR